MTTTFEPISALVGGALIGLAAVLLMLLTGRIAGISGIMAGCLAPAGGDRGWRLAFIAGLIAAPLLGALVGITLEEPYLPGSLAMITVGGLLVGFGTRLAGGCTSGHGICGTALGSKASFVATCVFLATAIAGAFLLEAVA